VDVQALAGDSTDNVPGAPGIGVKTAAQLINEYGDLETLLARAGEIKQPKRRETLTNPQVVELVRVSRQLVNLCTDVEVEVPLDDLGLHQPDPRELIAFLKALEFTTITRRAAEIYEMDANEIAPDPALMGPGGWRLRNGEVNESAPGSQATLDAQADPAAPAPDSGQSMPAALATARAQEARAHKIERANYTTIDTMAALDAVIAAAHEAGVVAVDTETSSLDPLTTDLVGVSLS
jgi:DNA polymerase-1